MPETPERRRSVSPAGQSPDWTPGWTPGASRPVRPRPPANYSAGGDVLGALMLLMAIVIVFALAATIY